MKDLRWQWPLGVLLGRIGVLAGLMLLVIPAPAGQAATPTATTVVTNPSFATLAVDRNGIAWGSPVAAPTQLWRSSDEGANWTRVIGWDTIGRRLWYVTPLADGALLAAYDTGLHWTIARSGNGGATWSNVLSLPCIQPDCTVRYTTLGPTSIAQGDGYVFLGTYSNAAPSTNTNYIYRSADDGVTWSVANTSTQFRHIHGLEFDPAKRRLYVLFGDSDGMATWYSPDDGATLKPICTSYACTSIEAAIDSTGASYLSSSDNPGQTNHIFDVDTTSGTRTVLDSISYPSYSVNQDGSILLVAEAHEPGPITDPAIHLYGSTDGGATWGALYAFQIPSTSGYYELHVESIYPNGDIAAQVDGQGTVVLRVASSGGGGGSVPVSSSAPVVSGVAQQGQSLSASSGGWSGSPTSYAYQWRRCDGSGGSCSSIAGASGSGYLVQSADVGFTLRARVTASNGAGAGVPADSAATAVVTASSSGGGGGSTGFGAAAAGGSSGAPGAGYKFGSPYTLAAAGTVSQFQFYARGGVSAQSFTPAIYGSSGSAPGVLIAAGSTVTVAAGQAPGWVTAALPATSLAAGTYYLVLVSGDASSQASVYYDAGGASDGVYDTNPVGAPSASFGTASTEPRRWSYRATS